MDHLRRASFWLIPENRHLLAILGSASLMISKIRIRFLPVSGYQLLSKESDRTCHTSCYRDEGYESEDEIDKNLRSLGQAIKNWQKSAKSAPETMLNVFKEVRIPVTKALKKISSALVSLTWSFIFGKCFEQITEEQVLDDALFLLKTTFFLLFIFARYQAYKPFIDLFLEILERL